MESWQGQRSQRSRGVHLSPICSIYPMRARWAATSTTSPKKPKSDHRHTKREPVEMNIYSCKTRLVFLKHPNSFVVRTERSPACRGSRAAKNKAAENNEVVEKHQTMAYNRRGVVSMQLVPWIKMQTAAEPAIDQVQPPLAHDGGSHLERER